MIEYVHRRKGEPKDKAKNGSGEEGRAGIRLTYHNDLCKLYLKEAKEPVKKL